MEKHDYDEFFTENHYYNFEVIKDLNFLPKLIYADELISEAITQSIPDAIINNLENICYICSMMPKEEDCLFTLEVYYTSIATNMARVIAHEKVLTADHLSKVASLIYAVKQWQNLKDYLGLTPWFVNKLIDIYCEKDHKILFSPYVNKAIKIIYEEIDNKNITTTYLAKKIGISVNYLITLFKDDMLETPAIFIKRNRIKMSALELRIPDLSLKEISQKYGFKSQSQFSKAFKDIYGISPLKYKANIMAKNSK